MRVVLSPDEVVAVVAAVLVSVVLRVSEDAVVRSVVVDSVAVRLGVSGLLVDDVVVEASVVVRFVVVEPPVGEGGVEARVRKGPIGARVEGIRGAREARRSDQRCAGSTWVGIEAVHDPGDDRQ